MSTLICGSSAGCPLALWLGVFLNLAVATADAATPKPARIGAYEVELQFTCSGNSSGAHSDATGSMSWSESYNLSLSSRVTYEVLQKGTNAYTGSQLSGSAELSVGGGGTSKVTTQDGSSTASWKYLSASGFRPTNSYVSGGYYSADGRASASTGYRPSLVVERNPSNASIVSAGFEAAAEAANGMGTSFGFDVPRTIEQWSRSGSRSTNISWAFAIGDAAGVANCTASARFIPEAAPEWEAILEAGSPLSSYEEWLPLGPLSEDSDLPANVLPIRVYLQPKGGGPGIPPKAAYEFVISDGSREPGFLMNFPRRTAPACDSAPEGAFDLKIHLSEALDVTEDGQGAETLTSVTEARAAVACYDFGAYGKLRVTVRTDDGQTLVAHIKDKADQTSLDIPLDSNHNHVADAWEKQMKVYDRNLPADWDGAEEPAGHAVKGDGISLYEKYRGFLVLNALGKQVYERLDPRKKHVFVRNPDRLVREVFAAPDGLPESYMAAAECELRYIGHEGWTGPGKFSSRKRVVNFNCSADKHAADQHALHIVVATSPSPVVPQDINDFMEYLGLPAEDPLSRRTEGVAYRDYTAPPPLFKEWRPAANYRTEVYAAAVKAYVGDTVLYHSRAACPDCTSTQLAQEAKAYELSHSFDAGRKYTIELSATITHEMGHGTGVQHHAPVTDTPSDDTLKNCTMRYYDREEFPANAADRFELEARGNNPDNFCRRKHNCWGQIKITDSLEAEADGAALARGIPAQLPHPTRLALASFPEIPGVPIPEPTLFELSADLAWDEIIEGDPLRFHVRLHGLNDSLTAPWLNGLFLRLVRLLPDDRAEEMLAPDAWLPFLSPNAFETTSLAVPNVTRISEWLAPSDRVELTPGPYRLEVSWHGRNLAPDAGLPPEGIVTLDPIFFNVTPATNSTLQAVHQRHLAWERFVADDPVGAVACIREAERLDPGAMDPLSVQARVVGATCSARLRDALGTARFLDVIRSAADNDNDHFADFAGLAFANLAPRMRWVPATTPGGQPARFEIRAAPGGVYLVQRSHDLRTWTSVSTNAPSASTFTVEEPTGGEALFYRVVWQQ